MNTSSRLTPTQSSRKLHAFEFIRVYRERFGLSPSTGEIAAALGVSAQRAKVLVRQLERDGLIYRKPHARRGIMIPTEIEAARALLESLGYEVRTRTDQAFPKPDLTTGKEHL